ncbi:hypothetical protein LshimejAT787_1801530 [Lyophyllum shimeji]|uniref:Uncharacterized protein n=1 Tax=Lyophyllum shimeji TaxID=47721 RepID=A0A9P3UW65_LYOSH|nr:hypothetical protein LshimejAT787_1801530 [Lyophyllum shimeji]
MGYGLNQPPSPRGYRSRRIIHALSRNLGIRSDKVTNDVYGPYSHVAGRGAFQGFRRHQLSSAPSQLKSRALMFERKSVVGVPAISAMSGRRGSCVLDCVIHGNNVMSAGNFSTVQLHLPFRGCPPRISLFQIDGYKSKQRRSVFPPSFGKLPPPTSSAPMASPSLLYALSLSDWERIAFYAVASERTFLGPPVQLLALSLVCRHIYDSISVQNNSRLYARIFRFKFDYAAPARRLTARWLTTRCLAKELISRFFALQRIRQKREFRPEDLWAAYLMMSESDGKNESQLLDWAGLRRYLDILVASRLYRRVPWGMDITSSSLLVWLLWMTTSRDDIQQEQAGTNDAMLAFLCPFVSSGYRVPSVYGPDSFFNVPLCEAITSTASHSSGPSPPCAEIIHFSHRLMLPVPIVTSAAALLITVRTEALQTAHTFPASAYALPADRATANALNVAGPTLEDVSRFHFQERIHASSRCTPNIDVVFHDDDDIEDGRTGDETLSPSDGSQRYEEDWSRLVNCYDPWAMPSPLRGKVYTVGSLAGSWEGRLMLPDFEAHVSALLDPRRSSSVPIQHKPLYWTLREHHCLEPNTPLGTAMGSLGDEDFLNAWLPRRISVRSLEDAIEVYDPETGLTTRYETFVPNRDPPYSSPAGAKLERPWISDAVDSSDDNGSQEGTRKLTRRAVERHETDTKAVRKSGMERTYLTLL